METLRLVRKGISTSLQDPGRSGWRRFGLPPSGWMDDFSARWANRLVGNPEETPVLETAWQGLQLEALRPIRLALTGARTESSLPVWQSICLNSGDRFEIRRCTSGLWSYLAVAGGIEALGFFGSASTYARGSLGTALEEGTILHQKDSPDSFPSRVAARILAPEWHRDFASPPTLQLAPGPQWDWFSADAKTQFFQTDWSVDPKSDRVGYRLSGPPLPCPTISMLSEPTLVGTVQVPPSGNPIVVMRDGPTIGGYPKLGVVLAESLDWLAQMRPGQTCRFQFYGY